MISKSYSEYFSNHRLSQQRSSSRLSSRASSPVPESSDIGTSPPHEFEDESEIIPQGEELRFEEEEDGEELFGDNLEA